MCCDEVFLDVVNINIQLTLNKGVGMENMNPLTILLICGI